MEAGSAPNINLTNFNQVRSSELSAVLDLYGNQITTLSLDCFDTLLWRQTAAPKDVFNHLQQRTLFQTLGVTAYQRMSAAARAYRQKFIEYGTKEITLTDIYRVFTSLSAAEQNALIEEEINAEMELCYAFPPFIELIRNAHARGLKIIIVSDIYLTAQQLRRILAKCLPVDVMNCIEKIFCSSEFNRSKQDGLFTHVLENLAVPAQSILHIGDNKGPDVEAPRKLNLHALHFLRFDDRTTELLRLQHAAASLSALSEPTSQVLRSPRYSPFRGVFATENINTAKPETLIGYMSFGPIMYAFARFICEEIDALKRAGKQPNVFFLLRDGYLLAQACAAYAGKPLGKLVRIRKFCTVAASFRTKADVNHYLAGITPQYYDFWVICEQLLIPPDVAQAIIQQAKFSPDPLRAFNHFIHKDEILALIFKQSTAYRERLKRYIKNEMPIKDGETVVLVDVGYIGVTQDFLTRTFKEELHVEITGRYFISSHEPDRPPSRALITSTACDHGLFEQSCTYKEGSVLDYDQDGNPIFDRLKLSEDQYAKVHAIQTECVRFIHDANKFFSKTNSMLPFQMLQENAVAVLRRHIHLPTAVEIEYFKNFQHDKDMGPTLTKTMYNIENGLSTLRQIPLATVLHPYVMRVANLEITLSKMTQHYLDVELNPEDMSLVQETVKIVIMRGQQNTHVDIKASQTRDGYFLLEIPTLPNSHLGIIFGMNYQWVQIDSVRVINLTTKVLHPLDIEKNLIFNEMTRKGGNLFECFAANSLAMVMPVSENDTHLYQVVFRPVVKRENNLC